MNEVVRFVLLGVYVVSKARMESHGSGHELAARE